MTASKGKRTKAGMRAARAGADGDPTLAVIVSSYNYAHYVSACLDSILAQTHAPDEIIVVDDGSTDGTAAVLARYKAAVRVIETANGGQAAAMNVGFAASASDLVLFVDADDLLRPEAVAMALAYWTDGLGHLTFELETVDAGGRSRGLHDRSVGLRSADNRPELLATGTFGFPPTSGNVFARAALAAALPMPEPRWRVSADCYLIRAAALWGATRHVPRVLGAYRLHGTNNYARFGPAARDMSLHYANQIDIVDAASDLAAAPRLHAGPDAPWVRAALEHLSLAKRDRLARSGVLPEALPHVRPAVYPGLSPDVFRSRIAPVVPLGEVLTFERGAAIRAGLLHMPDGHAGARTELDFALPPHGGALMVRLGLAAPETEQTIINTVTADGVLAGRGTYSGRTLAFSLKGDPWAAGKRVRIVADAWYPDSDETARAPEFTYLAVHSGGEELDYPLIPFNTPSRAAWRLERGADATAWAALPDGALELSQARGVIGFSAPAPGPARLVCHFAEPLPHGVLDARAGDRLAFSGEIGGTPSVSLALDVDDSRSVELALEFEPDMPGSRLCIADVELIAQGVSESAGSGSSVLAPGEMVVFSATVGADRFLDEAGWSVEPGISPRLLEPVARLSFDVQRACEEARLSLVLAPVFPESATGRRHVLGISRGDDVLLSAELAGHGEVEVPLGPVARGEAISLAVHSVFVTDDAEADPIAAPLDLVSMQLRAEQPVHAPVGPVIPRSLVDPLDALLGDPEFALRPAFQQLLDRAAAILDLPRDDPRLLDLAEIRSGLVSIVSDAAPALLLILSEADRFARLDQIAVASRPVPPTAEECAAVDGIAPDTDDTAPERLRAALLSVLLLPAHQGAIGPELDRIPAPLLRAPWALATYLGRAPELATAQDHADYRRWIETYLRSLNATLARGADTDIAYPLAVAGLRSLRPVRTIFGDGNVKPVVRLLAKAIERYMLETGADLWTQVRPRPRLDGRIRVGVLVRDVKSNPEGWALRGMYRGIDRSRFAPVLIRMDAAGRDAGEKTPGDPDVGDLFEEELVLSGLSVEASVGAIRALGLDLFVMGAYVMGWEKTSAIVAHRLAPVQLWHGAVCPSTSGFRSFDHAITCRATEPADPQRHYTEPLAWIGGPLQCAYPFEPTPPAHRADVRRDLGVPEGAVMLVSGAMAHKVQDELLRAWARILEQAPEALLVLYPFAPNWSMDYAAPVFEARLVAAGIPPDRVILLPTVQPERVRQIVAAADLYLDSFPYTGATTVCETLGQGTPALTLAGDALRQLTGASWVRAYGLDDLVAESAESYVDIAVGLLTDPEALAAVRERCEAAAQSAPHNDSAAFGTAYSETLWELAIAHGLTAGRAEKVPARIAATTRTTSTARTASAAHATPALVRRPKLRRFVILGEPRTGSTYLCKMLNRADGVICHYELFHQSEIQYRWTPSSHPAELAARNADAAGFLRDVYDRAARDGFTVVGFKHFGHESSDVARAIIDDTEIRLIHLFRDNLLAQFASETTARMSGRWASKKGDNVDRVRVPFDPEAFEVFMDYHRRVEREKLALLATGGRTVLHLEYGSLLDDAFKAHLANFLDISIPDHAEVDIQRQGAPVVLDRFEDPDSVARYIAQLGLEAWGKGG